MLSRYDTIVFLRALLNALVSVRVIGQENVPDGGAIIVCNHTDYMDSLIQGLYTGRSLTFLAKSEIMDSRIPQLFASKEVQEKAKEFPILSVMEGVMGPVGKLVMETGVVPVVRNYRGGRARVAKYYYEGILDKLVKMIKGGKLVAIYPEGKRSPTGRVLPFRGFAARVAMESGCPIVPAAVTGSYQLSDVERWVKGGNRSRSVIYQIGRPILPSEFPAGRDKRAVKELTARMEKEVRLLLEGQSEAGAN